MGKSKLVRAAVAAYRLTCNYSSAWTSWSRPKGGKKATLLCLAMSVDSMFAWLGEHRSCWNTWNWEPVGTWI